MIHDSHNTQQRADREDLVVVKWLKSKYEALGWLPCTMPRQGSAGSLPAGRVEFNGHLGYPHSGSTGTTGRAARGRRVPRSSSPAVAHAPNAVAAAQVPRGLNPGSGHIKPQTCIRNGESVLLEQPPPRSPSVAHLVSPLTRQTAGLCTPRSMAVARQMHPYSSRN